MTKNMLLIIVVLGILMMNFASADSIPVNSHPLSRCVKFANINDFSDVILIGFYTGPMVDTYEAYQIENDKCLDKGYKFNTLNIYWTAKEKFNSINLKDLKLDCKRVASSGIDNEGNPLYYEVYSPADLTFLLEDVEPYGGHVSKINPLIKETIEYSVVGYSDGKLVVYKSKRTSEYSMGLPEKVETFEKPNIDNNKFINNAPILEQTQHPEPQPVKRAFGTQFLVFLRDYLVEAVKNAI
ncbi:MAG: hypothetical protein U9N36_09405 [Euryarchaeota archaeon]|nr:hypothetical protein [Euryarchaeota archaeon]